MKMLVFLMLMGLIARVVVAQDCTATDPAAHVVLGQAGANFTAFASGAGLNQLSRPFDIAFVNGSTPYIVVTDFNNNRVLVFNTSAGSTSSLTALSSFGVFSAASVNASTLSGPTAITASGTSCWVTDSTRIRVLRYSPCGPLTTGAVSVLGQPNFTNFQTVGACNTTANRAITNRTFCTPQGLHADQSGNLWVADSNFRRVMLFLAAGAAANGSALDYQYGQESVYYTSNLNALHSPFGVYVDAGSPPTLFVSDNFDMRILAWIDPLNFTTPISGYEASDFVIGTYNGTGLGRCTNNTFGPDTTPYGGPGPQMVAQNPTTKTTWILDTGNNRIVGINNYFANAYSPTPTFNFQVGTPTQVLNCNSNGPFSAAPVTAQSLDTPQFIKFDPYISFALWVPDYNNNRVLRYCANPSVTPSNSISISGSVSTSISGSRSLAASVSPAASGPASGSPAASGAASGSNSYSKSLAASLAASPSGNRQNSAVTATTKAAASSVPLSSGVVLPSTSSVPVVFRCHRPCRAACAVCGVLGGTCTFLGNGKYQCVNPRTSWSFRYRVPGRQSCPPTNGKPHLTALCKAARGTFSCVPSRGNKRSGFTIVTCSR